MLILVSEKTQVGGSSPGKVPFYPKAFAFHISCHQALSKAPKVFPTASYTVHSSDLPTPSNLSVQGRGVKSQSRALCWGPRQWQLQRSWETQEFMGSVFVQCEMCLCRAAQEGGTGPDVWPALYAEAEAFIQHAQRCCSTHLLHGGEGRQRSGSPTAEAVTLKQVLLGYLGNGCIVCSPRLE